MSARRETVRLYRDAEGKWRWRYIARNGRILADSGQGYMWRTDAIYGAHRVTFGGRGARWVWR